MKKTYITTMMMCMMQMCMCGMCMFFGAAFSEKFSGRLIRNAS